MVRSPIRQVIFKTVNMRLICLSPKVINTIWQHHLEVRELCDPRPQVLIGSSQHPEDSEQLVNLRVALCNEIL